MVTIVSIAEWTSVFADLLMVSITQHHKSGAQEVCSGKAVYLLWQKAISGTADHGSFRDLPMGTSFDTLHMFQRQRCRKSSEKTSSAPYLVDVLWQGSFETSSSDGGLRLP
jgi:hypothetical protein